MSYVDPVLATIPAGQKQCRVRVRFAGAAEHEFVGSYESTTHALLDAQERYPAMQYKVDVEVLR